MCTHGLTGHLKQQYNELSTKSKEELLQELKRYEDKLKETIEQSREFNLKNRPDYPVDIPVGLYSRWVGFQGSMIDIITQLLEDLEKKG